MKLLRKSHFLLLAFLLSCAHKSNGNLIEFRPTQSLCLDAVVANMLVSGCKDMYVTPSTDYPSARNIQCSKSIGEINEWTVGNFLVFSSDDNSYMNGTDLLPVCTDGNAFIFYRDTE